MKEKIVCVKINYCKSTKEERAFVVDYLISKSKAILDKGTMFEIRARSIPNENGSIVDYGRGFYTYKEQCEDWQICLYQGDGIKENSIFHDMDRPESNGYLTYARLIVQ